MSTWTRCLVSGHASPGKWEQYFLRQWHPCWKGAPWPWLDLEGENKTKKKKVESKRMKYWVVSLYFFAGYGLQTSVTWEAGIQARRSFLIWNDENTHYENLSRATEPRWGALRVAHLRRPWKGLPLPTGSEIDSLKRFQISPASVEAIFQLSANRKVHAHLKFVGLFFPPYPKSDKCLVWEI